MKKILIIDDDNDINKMLTILLGQNGYETISAFSGTEGVMLHDESVDLILLDLMLPGKSGEEIIKDLKIKNEVPIIVLSAIHDVDKKVILFNLGADDYVTKPFHNDELLSRISVRLRSVALGTLKSKTAGKIISYRDINMNKEDYSASCNGHSIELSRTEFDLLYMLVLANGKTCTKSVIYDNVWNFEDSADDNTLNVYISKLRHKLKECNPETDYIETVRGIGYRLAKA